VYSLPVFHFVADDGYSNDNDNENQDETRNSDYYNCDYVICNKYSSIVSMRYSKSTRVSKCRSQ